MALASCKPDNSAIELTKAEVAEWESKLSELASLADAKNMAWHKTIRAKLNRQPVLGEKCPIAYDAGYPNPPFSGSVYYGTTPRHGLEESTQSYHVSRAWKLIHELRKANKPGNMKPWPEVEREFASIAADSYWDYELTTLTLREEIPEQSNQGKIRAGQRLVRALLYSYADDKVICEGLYVVGNGDQIKISYTSYGTPAELAREREAANSNPGKLDKKHRAMAVELDLTKKAYYAAHNKLFVVTGHEPLDKTDKAEAPDKAAAPAATP